MVTLARPSGAPALDAERGVEILRVEVGSTLHGTGLPGGEDLDLIGVALTAPEFLCGIRGDWETWTWRTQPDGTQSGPDDIDLTVHSARKYLRLALAGNPSMLLLPWAPDEFVHEATPLGAVLRRRARGWCRSREAGARFAGYLDGQRKRFLGEKARHGRVRPELIEQFGYDTKYAMHMIRLAHQGIEFLSSGDMTLPMAGDAAEECRAVRRGELTRTAVLARIDELDAGLRQARERSLLPEHPDREAANRWLVMAHQRAWARGPLATEAAAWRPVDGSEWLT